MHRYKLSGYLAGLVLAFFAGHYIQFPAAVAVAVAEALPVAALPSPTPVPDPMVEQVEQEVAPHLKAAGPGEGHIIAKTIVDEARAANFDPWFIVAVIEAESNFDVEACSPTNSMGLMQLQRATFKAVSTHYKRTDPVENIKAGISYLSLINVRGFRSIESVLRAYNGGEGVAQKYYKALKAGEPTDDIKGVTSEFLGYPSAILARYQRLIRAQGGDWKHPEKTWRSPTVVAWTEPVRASAVARKAKLAPVAVVEMKTSAGAGGVPVYGGIEPAQADPGPAPITEKPMSLSALASSEPVSAAVTATTPDAPADASTEPTSTPEPEVVHE